MDEYGLEIFVKCSSHRARGRLMQYVVDRQGYYSLGRNSYHGVYKIPEDDLGAARALGGITKCREQEGWSKCWSSE